MKCPATKSMNKVPLQKAGSIELGACIASGEPGVADLDKRSSKSDEKAGRKYDHMPMSEIHSRCLVPPLKRKRNEDSQEVLKPERRPRRQTKLSFSALGSNEPGRFPTDEAVPSANVDIQDLQPVLHKIRNDSTLTPYRKRLYSTLLSVPRGHYTTYAALASYLDSCARAVGNGMRNNPFAPEVPCHRVLASDRSIGGFCGDWGEEGKHAKRKRELLREEGVHFDGRGKAIGEPWKRFFELGMM